MQKHYIQWHLIFIYIKKLYLTHYKQFLKVYPLLFSTMAEKANNENIPPPAKLLKIAPSGKGKNKVININVGNGQALQGKRHMLLNIFICGILGCY